LGRRSGTEYAADTEPIISRAGAEEEREDFRIFEASKDVIEKEGSYAFVRQFIIKFNLFKYSGLKAF